MDNIININTTYKVTDEDIDDIMCSALEGGITYWCYRAEVVGKYLGEYASEQISKGGTLKLYVEEPDDEPFVELTKEKFLKGVTMAISDAAYADYDWYLPDGTLDPCEIDSDVADYIVQCALFGEVVYG